MLKTIMYVQFKNLEIFMTKIIKISHENCLNQRFSVVVGYFQGQNQFQKS